MMEAQRSEFIGFHNRGVDVPRVFTDNIARDLDRRADAISHLDLSSALLGNEGRYWTDGLDVYVSLYSEEENIIELTHIENYKPIAILKVRGNKVTTKDKPAERWTVEQIGAYRMLLSRDVTGNVTGAYYSTDHDAVGDNTWSLLLHYILAGHYRLDSGESVIFGLNMPFYGADRYASDPGFYSFCLSDDGKSVEILYGEGRVSHGDPSSPKYGKMPGGGGAAAIMGPMQWRVTPSEVGALVKIVHDERFVDHWPAVPDDSQLLKVQTPYEGLDGKWAFASVLPLTPRLLSIFPRDVLRLMRGEIYARYGDTFVDPATQSYFDRQPWYAPDATATVKLTDLERFNYRLIKLVEKQ